MKITLKQMVVFDAVARLGSVSLAAREIALTQSAASMALRDLERNLGVELFHRHRKRLVLNDHGRRLRPKVRSVLLGARDIEVTADAREHQGGLLIGASTTLGNYLLPDICASFLCDHPGVTIGLTVSPAIEIIERVDGMTLDIGFVESPLLRPTLRIQRWMDDELVVFCSAKHRLARQKEVRMRDLADETWCLQPMNSVTRSALTRVILNHVESIRVGLETGSVEAIKQAVMQGVGIGCQSRLAIREELKAGVLCEVPVSDLQLSRPCNIVSRKDIMLGTLHTLFVEHAVAALVGMDSLRQTKPARKAPLRRAPAVL